MTHSFDIEHAEKYGVGESIMIGVLASKIKNRLVGKCLPLDQEKIFITCTISGFRKLIPYYSQKQTRLIISNLILAGVLEKSFRERIKSDRTCSYSFVSQEFLCNTIRSLEDGNG